MIELKGVVKSFGEKRAVDDLDLTVEDGEIFGFIGPNGAGKTTTIKMIVGILEADGGEIKVGGIRLQEDPLGVKRMISYVPDNPFIYEKMTGYQYLNFLGDVYGLDKESRNMSIARYAQAFEIEENLKDYISGYSHGMQQKIALIGALLHEPEVLILDEPMVGLDPKSAFTLKELMKEGCQKGKTVFFSTHIMEVAEKLCHRIAIINHGKIVAVGTLEEIKSKFKEDGSLEEIFLELTE